MGRGGPRRGRGRDAERDKECDQNVTRFHDETSKPKTSKPKTSKSATSKPKTSRP
jgi:hypothetical protein